MVTITDKTKCSGCTACANICPQKCIGMIADAEGFLYPKIDENRCIKCGLCSKTCPIINNKKDTMQMPDIYACYAKDKQVLANGSSGSIFTLLATAFINNGGVVYGAAYDNAYNVSHIRVDDVINLSKLQKSKYLQSNLGQIYQSVKQDLLQGKQVMFSGTGCQIEGLQNFLVKKYDNLITVDVICHGVPSPKVWQKYLQQHKIPLDASVDFRSKDLPGGGGHGGSSC